jgi:beta-ureidopropionase
MITLLILGGAAVAAILAGASLKKKGVRASSPAAGGRPRPAVITNPKPTPKPDVLSPELEIEPSDLDVPSAAIAIGLSESNPVDFEPPIDTPPGEDARRPRAETPALLEPEPPPAPPPTRPTIIVTDERPPVTDPEPLPDADPEPVPITEPEPQPAPEPPPSPEAPPPTIIVATERPQVSFKTYRVTEPRAAKPIESVRAAVRPRASRIIRQPKSERTHMSRIVKGGLIQTSLACETTESLDRIREAQTERTLTYIDQAGAEGVQILCMQEIFTGPYFCAEQSTRWYDSVEKIPDGPTTKLMQEYAKKYNMVIVVPLYEEEETGVYYNTAAVIDADGKYLGKYRKNHIPHVAPGFWEKFYFRPGNLGYPVFETAYAKVGVYICYDRHFPEGARELGLAGAEIVMNPSATVAGLSEYLWKLEQPAHAVANGYFIGAINRVGFEAPWNIGEFYGQSYFCDPRGQMLAVGPRDADALVTADLDMDKIREVRNTWQFYRDRRPETYTGIVRL